MDIDELLDDLDEKVPVITGSYVKLYLEKKYFEDKFFGPEPVKFNKENAEIVKEYTIGKKK